jgi:hypothetical protein
VRLDGFAWSSQSNGFSGPNGADEWNGDVGLAGRRQRQRLLCQQRIVNSEGPLMIALDQGIATHLDRPTVFARQ